MATPLLSVYRRRGLRYHAFLHRCFRSKEPRRSVLVAACSLAVACRCSKYVEFDRVQYRASPIPFPQLQLGPLHDPCQHNSSWGWTRRLEGYTHMKEEMQRHYVAFFPSATPTGVPAAAAAMRQCATPAYTTSAGTTTATLLTSHCATPPSCWCSTATLTAEPMTVSAISPSDWHATGDSNARPAADASDTSPDKPPAEDVDGVAVIVDGERIGALTAAVASQCDCTVLRASSTRLPVSLSAITNSSTAGTGRSLNCAVNSVGRRLATPWHHTYYMRMHSINTQHTRIQPHTHTRARKGAGNCIPG